MKNRILELISKFCNGNNIEFSERTGINKATISNLKNGKANPTLDMVYKIQNAFPNINLNWLINGKGDMIENLSTESPKEIDTNVSGIQATLPFPESIDNESNNVNDYSCERHVKSIKEGLSVDENDKISDKEKKITQIIVVFNDGTIQVK